MNYKDICEQTIELARKTGDFIRSERKLFSQQKVTVKGKHNFVTNVDKQSELQLVEGLSKIVPGSGFIAEEGTASHNNETYKWIIDPLDGTTNFIHGAPPYSISIALMEDERIVVGVVYEITLDECFYAWEGGKSYLNGEEISVSDTESVSESLIATGFPYHDYDRLKQFMKTLDHFFHNSHGVRRLGSAAADLAYVACGRYDAFYEYGLHAWDVAAGAFIIQQAGGNVSDFNGGNNYLFGEDIVACTNKAFEEFQGVINQLMNG
ncbi:MAG: inositol monophosphatase [Bacteroidales bacterium]|nr:inositol monophosphatase [Bacteroidales bacterium]